VLRLVRLMYLIVGVTLFIYSLCLGEVGELVKWVSFTSLITILYLTIHHFTNHLSILTASPPHSHSKKEIR
ncbi:MAG: hypothetical protein J7K39_08155, partial [Bacteroidales bacterium]|nr:hypothetical protein [Bacteroidales bacterium]